MDEIEKLHPGYLRLQKDDELEEDVSYDSAYMLEAMRRVGTSMWAAFHWVVPPEDSQTRLSFHGQCRRSWDQRGNPGVTEELLTRFNIVLIH
jgi:hypothetical protein